MKRENRRVIGMVMFAVIAIGAMKPVRADYYGDTIRRHEDIATYNGYRAQAEYKMYKSRAKAYKKAMKRFKKYGISHDRAMAADAALVGIESQMSKKGYKPERSYVSDWAAQEVAAIMTRRGAN